MSNYILKKFAQTKNQTHIVNILCDVTKMSIEDIYSRNGVTNVRLRL